MIRQWERRKMCDEEPGEEERRTDERSEGRSLNLRSERREKKGGRSERGMRYENQVKR